MEKGERENMRVASSADERNGETERLKSPFPSQASDQQNSRRAAVVGCCCCVIDAMCQAGVIRRNTSGDVARRGMLKCSGLT